MNKTKSNKKKSCRQVITHESENWMRHSTSAVFAPVSRCVRLCREQQEQDTAQLCSGGFGPDSEVPTRTKVEAG